MKKAPIFLVLALAALSVPVSAFAQVGRVRPALEPAWYFPLRDGYRWVYQKHGPSGTSTWQVSVAEANQSTAGPRWYALSGYFPGPARLVHSDVSGLVTEADFFGQGAYLWYQLGARPGTTWQLEWAPSPIMMPVVGCISGSKLELVARDETVRVPAGEFRGVVHVAFYAPCTDAGITEEWFAPGVGLVRRNETTVAGPVTSELVEAELGPVVLPLLPYATTLSLAAPNYVNNLMPPVDLTALPVVRGSFTVRNSTDVPLVLIFPGCVSATIQMENRDGKTVLTAHADDGGCCTCDGLKTVTLKRSALVLPFGLRLISDDGAALPDGRYGVTVTLDTVDAPWLQPSARAAFEVTSTY
jgi:hypothetical protein